MTLYHLNLFNDVVAMDKEGYDCADLAAAKARAIAAARDLMAEHVRLGRPLDLRHRIEVADADGKVLAVLPFREIVTIRDDRPAWR